MRETVNGANNAQHVMVPHWQRRCSLEAMSVRIRLTRCGRKAGDVDMDRYFMGYQCLRIINVVGLILQTVLANDQRGLAYPLKNTH